MAHGAAATVERRRWRNSGPDNPHPAHVQKLHLVGSTTDSEGLILSARRGARSGGYTLVLDDALARAVDELRARQEEEAEAGGAARRGDRVESRLPISEIQSRLRRGRSLKDVAKEAGVDPDWVERFAVPVFAEQAGIISRVQGTHLKRARLGPSAVPIGDAVRRNLVERSVIMSPDEIARAWTTHQRPDGRWVVRFSFQYRGGAKTLRFEVKPNGDISASDPFTSQIAYVTPPQRRATPRPKPIACPVDPSAQAGGREHRLPRRSSGQGGLPLGQGAREGDQRDDEGRGQARHRG